MKKLSVVLATRNEEHNLDRCLSAINDIAWEIVIADEMSTDKTLEIAKKYNSRIIKCNHNENFHITKNIAIDSAKGDWILQLDADEVVSPQLAEEILEKINNYSNISGYWINRSNWFLSRFLKKGGQYPDPTIRLYKKGHGRLPARDVHEQAIVTGNIERLSNDLLHYRDTSFAKYMEGFDRYSTFISIQMKEKDIKFNLFNSLKFLIIKPIYIFYSIYIRHLGIVDGMPGFIFALFSGLIWQVSYIKYWQKKYYND